MKVYLTDGMFGEAVDEFGTTDSFVEFHDFLHAWCKINKDKFTVQPYFRRCGPDSQGRVAVDFGDH